MLPSFALFFTTRARSLRRWDELGMLERELKLYRAIASRFSTVYLFTYGGASDVAYQSILPENIVIVPKPPLVPLLLYSVVLPLIHWQKLKDVDILKTNQMDGSWSAVIAKKLFGGKLIVRCGYEWLQFIERAGRGWAKRTFARCAEVFAYRNADVIIHTSKEAVRFAVHRFAIPEEKIILIPNFIDTVRFAPTATDKKQGTVIYVGRLEPQKNVRALIESLSGLAASLTVVGQGSERTKLEHLAAEVSVAVQWIDRTTQERLPLLLGQHELFVLPSLYEGSPKTLLEAMSCGLPCIATDVTGSREVIRNGETGILAGTDSASLKGALQRLLGDQALRAKLGEAARREILEKYSFEKILAQELSVYNTLL